MKSKKKKVYAMKLSKKLDEKCYKDNVILDDFCFTSRLVSRWNNWNSFVLKK